MNCHGVDSIIMPFVSVVVCTRNRGDSICSTIGTILANKYPQFELIVVDQSTNTITEQAVKLFMDEPHFRYIHSETKGLSIARNIGIDAACADIVLMTDDDCEVPSDWIAKMIEVFFHDPKIGVVFCNVIADPYDTSKGFVPVSVKIKDVKVNGIWSWCFTGGSAIGIGAGMGLRKHIVNTIGGFDNLLGAGAKYSAGEDTDIAFRSLIKGYKIFHTNVVNIIHHGFRTHDEGRDLIRGYMMGSAVMYGKILRCGNLQAIPALICFVWSNVCIQLFRNIIRFRRPPILGRVVYIMKGLKYGLFSVVDKKNMKLVEY